ncbi:hypothetical protein B5F25_16820 [Bacteroides sp. An19]|nr:hypothetical protein B5F25_16820 [Bacteroides sp. An19]
MRKIAGYLTKNRSEKDQKIAQSTHENEYIKPRKTFWRNSKQLLSKQAKTCHLPNTSNVHSLRQGIVTFPSLNTIGSHT